MPIYQADTIDYQFRLILRDLEIWIVRDLEANMVIQDLAKSSPRNRQLYIDGKRLTR